MQSTNSLPTSGYYVIIKKVTLFSISFQVRTVEENLLVTAFY